MVFEINEDNRVTKNSILNLIQFIIVQTPLLVLLWISIILAYLFLFIGFSIFDMILIDALLILLLLVFLRIITIIILSLIFIFINSIWKIFDY